MCKVNIYRCEIHSRTPDDTKKSGYRHNIINNELSMLARTWDEVIEIVEYELLDSWIYDTKPTYEWDIDERLDKATMIHNDNRYTIRRYAVDSVACPQRLEFQYNPHNFNWKGDTK